jgi:hypothetical protein
MAHVASRNPKTAADERFEEYLVDHGVPYEHEPPWEKCLKVSAEVNPDFLIEPAGAQVVAEVKQFEATHITDRQVRVDTLSDRDVYGHQRAKMTEVAREQLRPFAGAGVPLVVVLANPLGADVAMDFHHVAHAILGNPKFTIRRAKRTRGWGRRWRRSRPPIRKRPCWRARRPRPPRRPNSPRRPRPSRPSRHHRWSRLLRRQPPWRTHATVGPWTKGCPRDP